MRLDRKAEFGIQWHITTKCNKTCAPCYMKHSEYFRKEKAGELGLEEMKNIVDNLVRFCQATGTKPSIAFTGGDPLLKPEFFKILEYVANITKKQSMSFSLRVLGNPDLLTPLIIKDLERFGVEKYQMSIDGLRETHDIFREKGSFEDTIRAYDLFKHSKITTLCMFSLNKKNASDLKEVIRIARDHQIGLFAFARIVPFKAIRPDETFSPSEYREFLTEIYDFQSYILKNTKTRFVFKDHLWKLFFYEREEIRLDPRNKQVSDGCGMGINSMSILADGTVYACRRFVSPVGKLPGQSIEDIFLGEKLNRYRDIKMLEKCSRCELLYHCRGCPAVAWGVSGSYIKPDPQCWK